MKWYHSVKVKLLGFFLLVALVFLISVMLLFSIMEKKSIEKYAPIQTSAATATVLSKVSIIEGRLEEIVLSLSAVAAITEERIETIQTLIAVDKLNKIISAGVWFEPYAKYKTEKDHFHFFNKNKEGMFTDVGKGLAYKDYGYREMDFYLEGKKLAAGDVAWTNAYTDVFTHKRMISVVSPIYKENQFMGVASIDIEINHKHSLFLKEAWSSTEYYLLMLDKEGTLLGHSTLVEKFIDKESNIYSVNSPEIVLLAESIKGMLSLCETQTCQNEVLKKGFSSQLQFVKNDPILGMDSVVATYYYPKSGWHVIIGMSEDKMLQHVNETYSNLIISILILILLATFFGFILLKNIFINPLEDINTQLNENITDPSKHYIPLHCDDKGEIGKLVENLNTRTAALEDSLEREAQEAEKRKLNEKLLEQQSKMAAMGEMMDAVAHQWKQPLNALSMYADLIKSDFKEGAVDADYVGQYQSDLHLQIDHMVSTLDEFRNFFRPNEEEEAFDLLTVINSVLFLTKDEFLKHRITLYVEEQKKISLFGSANEFKHLILNLLNNAKDAFSEDETKKRVIHLRLLEREGKEVLEVEDNAGGIPETIIGDIFKANVTTKAKGKGTGIGLYMSAKIVEKHQAILSVHNTKEGACFVVTFLQV